MNVSRKIHAKWVGGRHLERHSLYKGRVGARERQQSNLERPRVNFEIATEQHCTHNTDSMHTNFILVTLHLFGAIILVTQAQSMEKVQDYEAVQDPWTVYHTIYPSLSKIPKVDRDQLRESKQKRHLFISDGWGPGGVKLKWGKPGESSNASNLAKQSTPLQAKKVRNTKPNLYASRWYIPGLFGQF